MTELDDLLSAARQWANADPDPQTAQELRDVLADVNDGGSAGAAAATDLADRFSGRLEFGTAGLRAALGAGPMRMNRMVVRRAAAGFAAFLLDTAGGAYVPRAVVGYDARHNSAVFARESAAILTAAGIETFLLPAALPTPVLAYAVRELECEGGVMVTASHNPPQDNGYKVYLGGRAVEESARGAQIVPPFDAAISARIDAVGTVADVANIPLEEAGWTVLPSTLEADYVTAVAALADAERFPTRDLSIVLTPLHGVGGATAERVLAAAGFEDVTTVPAQAAPDPDFPTVAFPNPEEPGALDLALQAARDTGADIVLANDPDADRAAVAAADPATGEWRMLRGDEVGALLGAHLAARLGTGTAVFANSIVSSRLLARIAESAGFHHVETLTGFKWISRVPGLAYGYEEALGYCVAPKLVRDKDGISAALLVAELAADALARGRTVFDTLDDLALAHGLHLTDQLAVRVDSLDRLGAMMDRLRASPPTSFAGSPVETAVDLAAGSATLPPTDGLAYVTGDNTRVVIRPSGTEPKLKCYLEVIRPVGSAAELESTRAAARHAMDAVLDDVRQALGLNAPERP